MFAMPLLVLSMCVGVVQDDIDAAPAIETPLYAEWQERVALPELAKVIGYWCGQNRILDRIPEEYPDLITRVELLEKALEFTWGDSIQRATELATTLSPEWPDVFSRMQDELNASIDKQPLTPDYVDAFLDDVEGRTDGIIEADPGALLLALTPRFTHSPAIEMNEVEPQEIHSADYENANGADISLKVPRSWTIEPGRQPNVVFRAQSDAGKGAAQCIMIATPLSPQGLHEIETAGIGLLLDDGMDWQIGQDFSIVDKKKARLATRDAVVITFRCTMQQLDISVRQEMRILNFADEANLIQIQFSAGVGRMTQEELPSDEELDQLFEHFDPLFARISHSILVSKNRNILEQ